MINRLINYWRRFVNYFFLVDKPYPHDRGFHISYLVFMACFLLLPIVIKFKASEKEALSLGACKLPSSCLSRELFGTPCPGCGLTRSFVCLTHGEFAKSISYHRMGITLYVFFLFQFFYHAYCLNVLSKPIPIKLQRINAVLSTGMIVLLLVNWIL